MPADDILHALALPAAARIEQRISKTLLVEHGAPTAADKRRINDGIERIQWVATLKPTTIGIAMYKDAEREYLEIAVLRVALRPAAKAVPRLVELLHRAIPYPVMALVENGKQLILSMAHIRWSQGETGKTVLDGDVVSVDAPAEGDALQVAFADALALGRQPRLSLRTVYQGWMDALLALAAARVTGRFEILADAARRTQRDAALRECAQLDAEIARLRAAGTKEKQMARQVALNLELKQAEAARARALEQL
ncbi:MAG: DUF4391 domain-containing protein [Rhodanobacteraceae bacterium]|nr:MAG: DUF4391 domain-containing protein [Rhodanobacteraceae bacterium]